MTIHTPKLFKEISNKYLDSVTFLARSAREEVAACSPESWCPPFGRCPRQTLWSRRRRRAGPPWPATPSGGGRGRSCLHCRRRPTISRTIRPGQSQTAELWHSILSDSRSKQEPRTAINPSTDDNALVIISRCTKILVIRSCWRFQKSHSSWKGSVPKCLSVFISNKLRGGVNTATSIWHVCNFLMTLRFELMIQFHCRAR